MARRATVLAGAAIAGVTLVAADAQAQRLGSLFRSLPASPVDVTIDANLALSRCRYNAAGGSSARGSCASNASTRLSSTTTPTSVSTSLQNSASAATRASATGPGSTASGGGRASAGTLYVRLVTR